MPVGARTRPFADSIGREVALIVKRKFLLVARQGNQSEIRWTDRDVRRLLLYVTGHVLPST